MGLRASVLVIRISHCYDVRHRMPLWVHINMHPHSWPYICFVLRLKILYYVIATALCSIRRMFYYHPQLTHEIWERVCSDPPAYGPCGALSRYLAKVQWLPQPGGVVQMPSGHQISLQLQSTREIRLILRQALCISASPTSKGGYTSALCLHSTKGSRAIIRCHTSIDRSQPHGWVSNWCYKSHLGRYSITNLSFLRCCRYSRAPLAPLP